MQKPETQRTARTAAGFTLIELLVVVAILGILSTVVIQNVWSSIDDAKQTTTKTKVDAIDRTVQMYRRKHNRLPNSLEELTELDDMNNGEAWLNPEDLRDGWGYLIDLKLGERSNQFEIVSYGANGTPDGYDKRDYGLDTDISSKHALEQFEEDQ